MKIYATCFLPEASGSIAFPFCQAPGTASGSQKATALVQAPPTSLQIQTSLANTLLLSTAHVFTTVSQALVSRIRAEAHTNMQLLYYNYLVRLAAREKSLRSEENPSWSLHASADV